MGLGIAISCIGSPVTWNAIAFFLLISIAPAIAAESDTQQWTTATIKYEINRDVSASLTSRIRFDDDISHKKDLLVRPGLAVKATPNLTLGLGYDHLHAFPSSSRDENRLWQSMSLEHRLSKPALSSRLRLDERFIEGISGVILRARYRLRATYELADGPWYLAGSDEVFANLNSKGEGPVGGFEQNRLFLGLGREIVGHLKLEMGYQWGYQERRSEDLLTHSILVNFSIRTGGK